MVNIVFLEEDGSRHEVVAREGESLMEAARNHGIPSIRADCGGSCACSTCHVYVDPAWVDRLPPVEEMEEDMLEFAWEPDPDVSRLSCQITVKPEMEGLVLRLPKEQA